MDKTKDFEIMDATSMNLIKNNIEKLKKLFPNIVREDKIDFDMLRTILGDEVDKKEENYHFTWLGKRESEQLAYSPSSATLRPCKDKSKDWENTQNLYIEGDNLEVLKQLQKTYYGKIKMIYIDPPYNTGVDRIYKDDYKEPLKAYKEQTRQELQSNPETDGRYHRKWLNMMYPRLELARNLLSEDGVIFISIDDNEVVNLRKICDEIFGDENYVTTFIWEKKKKPSFLHKNIGNLCDYILCYIKNNEKSFPFSVELTTEGKKYPLNNSGNTMSTLVFPPMSVNFGMQHDVIEPQDMSEGNIKTILLDKVVVRNGYNENEFRLHGEWRYSQSKLNEILSLGEKIFISKIPFRPNHIKSGGEIKKMKNFLTIAHYNMETNEDASQQLIDIFKKDLFDNPKPIKLIETFVKCVSYFDPNIIVLDFFSGSATTAHAVMKLNAEDGGNRKFIMVQLPEKTAKNSEARKELYENICDLGEERIRKSGEILKKEWEEKRTKDGFLAQKEDFPVDIGFKVFKLDSTNIKQWDNYNQYNEEQLIHLAKVFKDIDENGDKRTKEDILYEVLLKYGIFDKSVKEVNINGKTMYLIGEKHTIVSLEDKIDDNDILEIGKIKPRCVIFKEDGFLDDNSKLNASYNLMKFGIEDLKFI